MWYEEPLRKEIIPSLLGAVGCLVVLSSDAKGGGDTLKEYWKRPIPLQRAKGIGQSAMPSTSFYPEACGECHKDQYNDWQGSLHSRSVGPGLLGQLNPGNSPQFAFSCYFCHAPMEGQAEIKQTSDGNNNYIKNPKFDNKLKLSGVSCPVCHLREGKVYGPPARVVVSGQWSVMKSKMPHNDFIARDFFEKAEFCAACHQLDEGYELNGKVFVNTYREWKGSIYGKNNVSCQNCHMPDRRHLWRGIHDPEMVKKGITIEAMREKGRARLIITNAGVGHYFPTYATPMVVVKGFMLDKKGKVIHSSIKETFIGRQVSLDLSEEFFDTRIPPQGRFEFTYEVNQVYNKYKLVFEVWVYPDEFYNRFYKEVLDNPGVSITKEEIEKAFLMTEGSGYLLYRKVL